MHARLGERVGYRVRFEDASHPTETRVLFLTDGMVLRETLRDPLLSRYSVLMLDEAHERNANTDLLLAMLRRILPRRPDLRLIISSATLQAASFVKFFSAATLLPLQAPEPSAGRAPSQPSKSRWGPSTTAATPADSTTKGTLQVPLHPDAAPHSGTPAVVAVPGRTHPVDVQHLAKPARDFLQAAVDTTLDIHSRERPGDILVFLPTAASIDEVVERLRNAAEAPATTSVHRNPDTHAGSLGHGGAVLQVAPLYAALPPAAQTSALTPPKRRDAAGRAVRKVVVATNIAETSVTIPGVRYVVDSGFANLPVFNPLTGLDAHIVQRISKASAAQRAGRAGRTAPGKAFRLYTQADHDAMPAASIPDVLRVPLDGLVLQMKALGIRNLATFPMLATPFPLALQRALEHLAALGALDPGTGDLTSPLGEFLAEFPAPAPVGAMLLWSAVCGCAEEALTAAAMLAVKTIYAHGPAAAARTKEQLPEIAATSGDLVTFVNLYNAWQEEGYAKTWAVERGLHFMALRRVRQLRKQLRKYLVRILITARERVRESGDEQGAEDVQEAPAAAPTARGGTLVQPLSAEEATHWKARLTLRSLASSSIETCGEEEGVFRRCVARAFFANAAVRLPNGRYRTLKDGRSVAVHPSSVLHRFGMAPRWVVFCNALLTDDEYVQHVCEVQQQWLVTAAPHFFRFVDAAGAGQWSSSTTLTHHDLSRASATDGRAVRREPEAQEPAPHLNPAAALAGPTSTSLAVYSAQDKALVATHAAAGQTARKPHGPSATAQQEADLSAVDALWAGGRTEEVGVAASAATGPAVPGHSMAAVVRGVQGGAGALQGKATFVPRSQRAGGGKRPRSGTGAAATHGQRGQRKAKRGLSSILAHLRDEE